MPEREIGAMNKRLAIQTATETADTHGAPIEAWATENEVWASIEPLVGRELFAAQQVHAEVSHRIRIRWLAGVTPKKRGLYGSRVFDFQSIANLEERNRELEIIAVERV